MLIYQTVVTQFTFLDIIADILSLLKTANRHGLEAKKYMTYLLEHLPNEETLAKKVLEAYSHGRKR